MTEDRIANISTPTAMPTLWFWFWFWLSAGMFFILSMICFDAGTLAGARYGGSPAASKCSPSRVLNCSSWSA